jgi:hypothetical protein
MEQEPIGGSGVLPFMLHQPEYQSTLTLHYDLHFHYSRPMPNPWYRFWQWALLGFKWKPYK